MAVRDLSLDELERLRGRLQDLESELKQHEARAGFCANNRVRASFGKRCDECEAKLAAVRDEMHKVYDEMAELVRQRPVLFPFRPRL